MLDPGLSYAVQVNCMYMGRDFRACAPTVNYAQYISIFLCPIFQDLPTLEMMDPQNRKISFFIEVSVPSLPPG